MEELKPNHLGIVVKDAEKISQFLSSLWKLGPWQSMDYIARKEDMIVGDPFMVKLVYAKLGTVTLELVEPVQGKSIWADFLEIAGGGVHHIAFTVPDWEDRVVDTKAQGGKMLVGASFRDGRWCYFKLPYSGMIIEFMDGYGI